MRSFSDGKGGFGNDPRLPWYRKVFFLRSPERVVAVGLTLWCGLAYSIHRANQKEKERVAAAKEKRRARAAAYKKEMEEAAFTIDEDED